MIMGGIEKLVENIVKNINEVRYLYPREKNTGLADAKLDYKKLQVELSCPSACICMRVCVDVC